MSPFIGCISFKLENRTSIFQSYWTALQVPYNPQWTVNVFPHSNYNRQNQSTATQLGVNTWPLLKFLLSLLHIVVTITLTFVLISTSIIQLIMFGYDATLSLNTRSYLCILCVSCFLSLNLHTSIVLFKILSLFISHLQLLSIINAIYVYSILYLCS